jgi:hypothetical protein
MTPPVSWRSIRALGHFYMGRESHRCHPSLTAYTNCRCVHPKRRGLACITCCISCFFCIPLLTCITPVQVIYLRCTSPCSKGRPRLKHYFYFLKVPATAEEKVQHLFLTRRPFHTPISTDRFLHLEPINIDFSSNFSAPQGPVCTMYSLQGSLHASHRKLLESLENTVKIR